MKQTTSTTHINSSRASQPGDYVAENIPLSAETTTISPTISPRDSEKKKAWPSVPVEVDNYFHSEPLETDSNKIKYFEINEFDVAKLAHDLADNISVTSIQIGTNNFLPEDGKAIAEVLSKALTNHASLTKLKLFCKISIEAAILIAQALALNKTLKHLILCKCDLDAHGFIAFANALKFNTTLRSLELIENEETQDDIDKGVEAIAEALKVNNTLKKLNLQSNKIGPSSTKKIAETLKINRTLKKLSLENNDISDEGIEALAEALKINNSLKSLNIYRNDIFDVRLEVLAAALKVNKKIKIIYLDKNLNDGMHTLADALKLNPYIKKLRFRDANEFGGRNEPIHTIDEKELIKISDTLEGTVYRNNYLWQQTESAGAGIAKLINRLYPGEINDFPNEVGNIIAEQMIWLQSRVNPSKTNFQEIEKRLFELACGTKC